jgi:hypothetical protein
MGVANWPVWKLKLQKTSVFDEEGKNRVTIIFLKVKNELSHTVFKEKAVNQTAPLA